MPKKEVPRRTLIGDVVEAEQELPSILGSEREVRLISILRKDLALARIHNLCDVCEKISCVN